MRIFIPQIPLDNFWAKLLNLSFLSLVIIGCFGNLAFSQESSDKQSLLIFTKTEGFRHASIATGIKAITRLANANNIQTLHTEDARYFRSDRLSQFDAVMFLNTSGNILNEEQQNRFKTFIQNGGGFIGIHAAADTEFNWPWYGRLVGAYFKNHPPIQKASIKITSSSHPATSFLPSPWERKDEWYNYKNISDSISVLLQLDESSYSGGENGHYHPISWYQQYDGGKAFYTGLGHTKASYSAPLFLKHLLGGITYVLEVSPDKDSAIAQ